MKIRTTRFGDIQISKDEVVEFPEGVLGFPGQKRYVILEPEDIAPCKWMQSVDCEWLAFIIVDPFLFMKEYEFDVSPEDAKFLEISDPKEVSVYVILTVDDDPRKTTANLQAPIVISKKSHRAKQIILADSDYSIRHTVLQNDGEGNKDVDPGT